MEYAATRLAIVKDDRQLSDIMEDIFYTGDKLVELKCKMAHLRVEYYEKDGVRSQREIADEMFVSKIKVAELEAEEDDLWNEYHEGLKAKNILSETTENFDG